jgi:thiosulfate/3-mercaptopyruvate sulfurtransferase
MGEAEWGKLVDTAWLEAHLDDPELRIFECTTHLLPAEPGEAVPYHPKAGRAAYDAGHIKGAGFLDLPGELSDPGASVHFMMPPAGRLADVLGRHGIGEGVRVVLYSRERAMWATRVWWMLHALGFDRAAVLDGGYESWVAEGRPTSRAPACHPRATFVPRPRPGLLVDKEAVRAALDDPSTLLINTLSRQDFEGQEPSRYGRPGRIPGSVSLPWAELTDPGTGAFIPLETAKARLEALGAERAARIVCYCGGGISATMALFLLHRLGYDNLALYDASMAEWARDPDLPIERG